MANKGGGISLSWEQLWAYLNSDYCTEEIRRFTLKSLNVADCLKGATKGTQDEILQYAPDYIKNDPEVLKVLGRVKQVEVTTSPYKFKNGMTQELFDMYKKRWEESVMNYDNNL